MTAKSSHPNRIALVLSALALLLGVTSVLSATTYLYVESNIGNPANQNSVFGFASDGAGQLNALPGSPYLTGGSGVFASGGTQFNADQEVTADPAGTLLYAVDGGSNTIGAFAINGDGTLTKVPGSPFPSGGPNPVSIGISGRFLVVANKNEDPRQDPNVDLPNYTTFTVNSDGSLVLNPGSTIDLPRGSSPSQALVWPKGRVVFGLELKTSRIASYKFDRAGLMTEMGSVSPPVPPSVFLGEILHPTKKILYVGLLRSNELGVYRFDASGVMTYVTSIQNNGLDICWLKTNAAGTRLYTSESVSNTLTVYDISQPLAPVEIQHFSLVGPNGSVTNIALDPTESSLYALAGTAIHVLSVDASGLLSQPGNPVPLPGLTNQRALGLVAIRK